MPGLPADPATRQSETYCVVGVEANVVKAVHLGSQRQVAVEDLVVPLEAKGIVKRLGKAALRLDVLVRTVQVGVVRIEQRLVGPATAALELGVALEKIARIVVLKVLLLQASQVDMARRERGALTKVPDALPVHALEPVHELAVPRHVLAPTCRSGKTPAALPTGLYRNLTL